MVLSHKKSYSEDSFKYFIGYRHKGNALPSRLCVKLPQMNTYAKYFDEINKKIFKKIFRNTNQCIVINTLKLK